MTVKTHRDCDKPALSFALEAGGVKGRVEGDRATGAAILVDSWLFTRDSSESIEA